MTQEEEQADAKVLGWNTLAYQGTFRGRMEDAEGLDPAGHGKDFDLLRDEKPIEGFEQELHDIT